MTKHRKPEEWIAEILECAGELVSTEGYSNLTMERIVARTGLSKGGVYRFFSNKREVALALFREGYQRFHDFDVEAVAERGLSLEETLFQTIFEQYEDDEREERSRRIWLNLLPEAGWDDDFAAVRTEVQDSLRRKYHALIMRIIERDERPVPPHFEEHFETALQLGIALMEGMSIQQHGVAGRAAQAAPLRRFLAMSIETAELADA